MGNMILFPAPPPTYSFNTDGLQDHLVWIPDDLGIRHIHGESNTNLYGDVPSLSRESSSTLARQFPAIWFSCNSRHTLLYFHGNSADLGDIYDEMYALHRFIECNILALEFPGYGICSDSQTSPTTIDQWGRAAFNWLLRIGADPMSIIPFGRSIGTGPAAKLAASLKQEALQPGGLILHSPYRSIHKIVSDYTSLGTWVIGNHWDTEKYFTSLSPVTPLLIIHGENDEVISVEHGKKLLEIYDADSSIKEGSFPKDSPHNAYLVIEDLGIPIKNFLYFKSLSRRSPPRRLTVDEKYRSVPLAYIRSLSPDKEHTPNEINYSKSKIEGTSSSQNDLVRRDSKSVYNNRSFIQDRPLASSGTGGLVSAIKNLSDIPSSLTKSSP